MYLTVFNVAIALWVVGGARSDLNFFLFLLSFSSTAFACFKYSKCNHKILNLRSEYTRSTFIFIFISFLVVLYLVIQTLQNKGNFNHLTNHIELNLDNLDSSISSISYSNTVEYTYEYISCIFIFILSFIELKRRDSTFLINKYLRRSLKILTINCILFCVIGIIGRFFESDNILFFIKRDFITFASRSFSSFGYAANAGIYILINLGIILYLMETTTKTNNYYRNIILYSLIIILYVYCIFQCNSRLVSLSLFLYFGFVGIIKAIQLKRNGNDLVWYKTLLGITMLSAICLSISEPIIRKVLTDERVLKNPFDINKNLESLIISFDTKFLMKNNTTGLIRFTDNRNDQKSDKLINLAITKDLNLVIDHLENGIIYRSIKYPLVASKNKPESYKISILDLNNFPNVICNEAKISKVVVKNEKGINHNANCRYVKLTNTKNKILAGYFKVEFVPKNKYNNRIFYSINSLAGLKNIYLNSLTDRSEIYANSFKILRDNWSWGIGGGCFSVAYLLYREPTQKWEYAAHSDPIQELIELGVVIFSLKYLTLIFYLFLIIKNDNLSSQLYLIYGALAISSLYSFFDFPTQNLSISYLYYMLIPFCMYETLEKSDE